MSSRLNRPHFESSSQYRQVVRHFEMRSFGPVFRTDNCIVFDSLWDISGLLNRGSAPALKGDYSHNSRIDVEHFGGSIRVSISWSRVDCSHNVQLTVEHSGIVDSKTYTGPQKWSPVDCLTHNGTLFCWIRINLNVQYSFSFDCPICCGGFRSWYSRTYSSFPRGTIF